MLTEKILIQNFAGIREMEIEVKKINILIGPQASGKSIVAKILYYLKGFIENTFEQGLKISNQNDFSQGMLESFFESRFSRYFPANSLGEKEFCIQYFIGDSLFIEIKKESKNVLYLSDFYVKIINSYKELIDEFHKKIPNLKEPDYTLSKLSFISEAQRILSEKILYSEEKISLFSQYFVPANRIFFAGLESGIFSILHQEQSIDPFLLEFAKYYSFIKPSSDIETLRKNSYYETNFLDLVSELKQRILPSEYIRLQDEDFVKTSDGRQVKLSNCSSGEQSILPLIITLEKLLTFIRSSKGLTNYIEEPEAHVFPETQRDIVDLISTIYGASREKLQFFVTTHSPYILTAFNNLLQAGVLAQGASPETLEQIKKVVPESRFLYPGEVAAYSLSNGECVSIIDAETGLIDAEMIDSVSEDLAVQFDQLLEID